MMSSKAARTLREDSVSIFVSLCSNSSIFFWTLSNDCLNSAESRLGKAAVRSQRGRCVEATELITSILTRFGRFAKENVIKPQLWDLLAALSGGLEWPLSAF